MSERDTERRLDEELANMTDRYLSDQSTPPAVGDLGQYDEIVRGLYAFLHDDGPSAVFERRLAQRLDHEWALQAARRTRGLRLIPVMRVLAVVASVLLLIGLAALLVPPPREWQGSVVGEYGAVIIIMISLAMLLVVGVIAFLALRRR